MLEAKGIAEAESKCQETVLKLEQQLNGTKQTYQVVFMQIRKILYLMK